LFGDFVRLAEKQKKSIEGTGLGLAITHSLCRAMGGEVTAESEYGKGSVFTATLRQSIADRRRMGAVENKAAVRTETQRILFTAPDADILLVDDLPSNLLVAEGLLSPYNVRIVTCRSGREAVELVRSRSFDLVFMDHMMPGMDGLEATAAIRAMDERDEMPIVALTANAVSGMREMFLLNGFDDFLSKPIAARALEAILRKWIPMEKQRTNDRNASGGAAASVMQAGLVDGLDMEKGIQNVGGDKAAYAGVLSLFRQDCETLRQEMLMALADGDYPAYAVAARALKGSLRMIGAGQLAISAMRLENAASNEDVAFLQENTRPFLDKLPALAGAFDSVLPGLTAWEEDRSVH
jgi:CheY-like chemotaxis protein/HPt (histidine-containing phosphotransfer) domain-containing protein